MTLQDSLRHLDVALATHGRGLRQLIVAALPDASPDVRAECYAWVVLGFWLAVWSHDGPDEPTDRQLLQLALAALVARLEAEATGPGRPAAVPDGTPAEVPYVVSGDPPVRTMTEASAELETWVNQRGSRHARFLAAAARPGDPSVDDLWPDLILAVWQCARSLPADKPDVQAALDAFAFRWCVDRRR